MSRLQKHVKNVKPLYNKEEGFSNFDLALFLNKLNLSDFVGVAAADTIPVDVLNTESHFTICVNLDPLDKKGSHFIVLVGCPTEILYVDSLALPQYFSPPFYRCTRALNRPVKSLLGQEDRIQSWESKFCAGYCALACAIYDRNYSPASLTPFTKAGKESVSERDLAWNDLICQMNLGKVHQKMKLSTQSAERGKK